MTAPAWLVPTARATPWQPLACVTASLAVVLAVAAYADTWPAALVGVASAALAAALVAGLHDPAAALLAAMPTPAATRRARRLVLLLPAGTAIWVGYVGAGQLWLSAGSWPIGGVLALTMTGVAVAVWAPFRLPVEAGIAVPLAWYAVSIAGAGLPAEYAEVLAAWRQHPRVVVAVATAVIAMGRTR